MSQRLFAQLPDLIIAEGETDSNFLLGVDNFNDAYGLLIYSPTGLSETVGLQVSYENELYGPGTPTIGQPIPPTDWYVLNDDTGTAIEVPATGTAQLITPVVFAGALKLVAGDAVGADRTFKITKVYLAGY